MERLTHDELFFIEGMEADREEIRYLTRNIAEMKDLLYKHQDDPAIIKLISNIIQNQIELIDDLKRSWENARKRKAELERILRTRPSDQQPGNGHADEGKKGHHPQPKIQNTNPGQGS